MDYRSQGMPFAVSLHNETTILTTIYDPYDIMSLSALDLTYVLLVYIYIFGRRSCMELHPTNARGG